MDPIQLKLLLTEFIKDIIGDTDVDLKLNVEISIKQKENTKHSDIKKPLLIDETCNYCGKDKRLVNVLIKGNDSYICDECISVCDQIIIDNKRHESDKEDKENIKVL